MPQHITSTARMQCDKGAAPAPLIVTSQQFVTADDKAIATEKDIQPNTNIPSFGVCAVTQKTCLPVPSSWQKCAPFTIEDHKELTTDSYCPCTIGGTIRFTDSGHSGFISTEN